jgi:hypothetical protein
MNCSRSIVLAAVLLWWPSIGQAQPNKDLYDLQERCGRRAEEVFERTYKPLIEIKAEQQVLYNFENHYNPRLNKCFFLLTWTNWQVQQGKPPQQGVKTMLLIDLNDNRQYGDFVEHGFQGAVFTCEARGKQCRSEQEWRELIKPFMEN